MLNKIKFSYEELANFENLFTPNHRKYKCVVKYNGKQYTFDYQCNPRHMLPNINDCIDSILLDSFAYDNANDILDFANEFGYDIYEQKTEVKRIYNACKRTSKAIHRIFTDDELSILQDEINDYNYNN